MVLSSGLLWPWSLVALVYPAVPLALLRRRVERRRATGLGVIIRDARNEIIGLVKRILRGIPVDADLVKLAGELVSRAQQSAARIRSTTCFAFSRSCVARRRTDKAIRVHEPITDPNQHRPRYRTLFFPLVGVRDNHRPRLFDSEPL